MSRAEWQQIVELLAGACARAGFDLLHPFPVEPYNAQANAEERLPDVGRPDALGILIGNTRQLWPPFVAAHAADPELQAAPHPLDTYVTRQLTQLLETVTSRQVALVFSHVTKPRAFPIQRLAEQAEFAALSPSHLAIHPAHGPWFALRAVAVIAVAGPEPAPPAPRPCNGCPAPCVPALDHALTLTGPQLDASTIAARAEAWIAVRDACPVGKASRYAEHQLAYHYGKDRSRIRP